MDNGRDIVAFPRVKSQSLISRFYVPARRGWGCVGTEGWISVPTYGSIEIQLVDNGRSMVALPRAESQSLMSHFYVFVSFRRKRGHQLQILNLLK